MRLYISGSVRKIASTVMPSVSEASLPGDPSFYSGLQASCLSLRSGRRLMRRSLAIEAVSQLLQWGEYRKFLRKKISESVERCHKNSE